VDHRSPPYKPPKPGLSLELSADGYVANSSFRTAERVSSTLGRHDAGPILPSYVTIEEIESYLDRIALAVEASPDGQQYLLWYQWLECEIEAKHRQLATIYAISNRIKRLQDRMGAPS
jgi:hypothetical protein